jgi:hypothetical protein
MEAAALMSLGKMKEGEPGLDACSAGCGVVESPLGSLRVAAGEVNHGELVMSGADVQEIDCLDRGAGGGCFGFGVAKSPERSEHFGSVDLAVAGDSRDTAGFDCLDPFGGPAVVAYGELGLGGPAEDLPGSDGPEFARRRGGQGFVEHGLGLVEASEPGEGAPAQSEPDGLYVSVGEGAADSLRLGGSVRRGFGLAVRHGEERRGEGEYAVGGTLLLILEEPPALVVPASGDRGTVPDVVVPDDEQGRDGRPGRLAGV